MWGDRSTNGARQNSNERTARLLKGAKCHQRRTTLFCVNKREQCYRPFITSERITETTNFIMVDHETELFTGAPTRGHLPVWLNMIGKDTKEVELKKNLKNANWEGFYDCVESLLPEGIDFKTMDADSSWLLLKEALQTDSD